MLWRERYNPSGTSSYVPLPPPGSREYPRDFPAHDVAEINPRFLAIDLSAITEFKGTFLLIGAFAVLFSFFMVGDSIYDYLYSDKFDSDDLQFMLLILSAPFLMGVGMLWAALVSPLHPPVYFNRETRKVYGWQKPPGGKGRWFEFDFDQLIAVTRIYHLYNTAGRQTQYILQLLDVDPRTQQIRFAFAACSAGWSHTPEGMWEFIRRYMNEAPGSLPAAQVNMRTRVDGRRQALSVYEEGTIGSVDLETGKVISPFLLTMSWIGAFYSYPSCCAEVDRT